MHHKEMPAIDISYMSMHLYTLNLFIRHSYYGKASLDKAKKEFANKYSEEHLFHSQVTEEKCPTA